MYICTVKHLDSARWNIVLLHGEDGEAPFKRGVRLFTRTKHRQNCKGQAPFICAVILLSARWVLINDEKLFLCKVQHKFNVFWILALHSRTVKLRSTFNLRQDYEPQKRIFVLWTLCIIHYNYFLYFFRIVLISRLTSRWPTKPKI